MVTVEKKTDELPLHIWERLQLVVGGDDNEGVYNCRVSDIEAGRLLISRPVFAYGQSLLADNRPVRVHFTRQDAAYMFRARLKETEPKSADAMYLLDLSQITRRQRRRFVRLEKLFDIKYLPLPRPLGSAIDLEAAANRMTIVQCRNISAGGLLMEAEDEVDVGSLVLFDLAGCGLKSIPRYLLAVCRQVRKGEQQERLVGVEFLLRSNLSQHLKKTELAQIPKEACQFTLHVQNDLADGLPRSHPVDP